MKQQWKLWPWAWWGFVPTDSLKDADPSGERSEDHDEIYRTHQRNIDSVFWFTVAWSFLVASYIWLSVSLFWDWQAESVDHMNNWFAPSGAILAALALVLEWRLKCFPNNILNNQVVSGQYFHFAPTRRWNGTGFRNDHNLVGFTETFVLISILVGTIVWAYGDKIVLCLAYGELGCASY